MRGYYRTAYEIQKGLGLGWNVGVLDDSAIDEIIKKPWCPDGKNFSNRIWTRKVQMVDELHRELLRVTLLGEHPTKAIDRMLKYVDGSIGNARHAAGRLAMTEAAYFGSKGQQDSFNVLGVEEYEIVATLDTSTSNICREMDGKHFPMSEYKAGVTAPPFHPYCRTCTCPYFDDEFTEKDIRAARDEEGEVYHVPANMKYEEWQRKFIKQTEEYIRVPVDIEFKSEVSGYKDITGGYSVKTIGEKYGQEAKVITLNSRNITEWNELPDDTKNNLKYSTMNGKKYQLSKGEYEVRRYVEGSMENAERDRIAKELDAKYLGFAFQRKNNQPIYIDFYEKGDGLLYSIGKANVNKTISETTAGNIGKIVQEREDIIIKRIGEKHLKNISERVGDDWVSAMKEYHKVIRADGKPSILPDAEYDAIKSPTLYRGIAPQSRLRKDITNNLTTKEMADEFFNSTSPFPSRGIYGDGIAYAAPSYKEIAWNYATNGGKQLHGGAIIEFKLREDAKTIEYEDALALFRKVSKNGDSRLLFNPTQKNSRAEVGKAMNSLGYDAIIKHNGDNTGIDFYVILNRAALVTKKEYITKAL